MPISQKKLRAQTRTVTKIFDEDPEQSLTVKYKIHAFSVTDADEYTARLMAINANGDDPALLPRKVSEISDIYADFLARVVVEWDLLDENDEVVATDKESIKQKVLPDVLSFAFTLITEDKKGGKNLPADSQPSSRAEAGSSTAARSERGQSQSGSRSG